MNEIVFGNVIEITLSVSIVITLLLILSKVLNKKYTAKWRYWVWMVLAIRLILPFNITVPDPPIHLTAPEVAIPVAKISDGKYIQAAEEKAPLTGQAIENTALPKIEAAPDQNTTSGDFDYVKMLIIIWIAGTGIFLAYQLIIYFSYRKSIKPWCRDIRDQELLTAYENIRSELKVIKKIPIMTCKIIKSPMVMGFWKPVLLLPDADFPPQHLKMILRHELIHVKRKDILYKALFLLARAVHWFNPLVHIMSIEANKDVELSCDAAVVENKNVDYRKDYSEAILSVIHRRSVSKAVFSTYFGGGKKVLKNRFASLFDLRRKRKGAISLVMVVLILGIMGLCISCTQKAASEKDSNTDTIASENTDAKTDDNIDTKVENTAVFKSEALGFALEFPKDWEDRFIIEESENSIDIYNKKTYEKYKGTGRLFTIQRIEGQLITQEDMLQEPVSQQIVLQGNGYTYFTVRPSDMQYPPDDKEVSSDYETMAEQITDVPNWMTILGDKKPKASNEGFKVVGSSFFTVEIPSDWELKVQDGSAPGWDVYAGDNHAGWINLIPYKSERPGEENTAKDNWMHEYLLNDETFREIRITLNLEYADKDVMGKIRKSFKFTNGAFNVVDLQTNALQYLTRGGKKVFGTIEGFDMKNGKPVAVRVNVMNFLTDNPNNEYPNGFRIEDLKKIETYSLEFQVNIVPLVAPDYNTYGIYEMPLLDESFIENYKNYKDFFYDFIIGSDGQLKIILGHYVP